MSGVVSGLTDYGSGFIFLFGACRQCALRDMIVSLLRAGILCGSYRRITSSPGRAIQAAAVKKLASSWGPTSP